MFTSIKKMSSAMHRSWRARQARLAIKQHRHSRLICSEPLEPRHLLAVDVGYISDTHVFSMDDVIGGFDGSTYAENWTSST